MTAITHDGKVIIGKDFVDCVTSKHGWTFTMLSTQKGPINRQVLVLGAENTMDDAQRILEHVLCAEGFGRLTCLAGQRTEE